MSLDEDLDRLYRLPLDEFTAARNEIAKRAGSRGADIRKLSKPPIAAWAVNQLYWKDREAYDALVEAAAALRAAHTSVLKGKRADLRFPGKEHEEALEQALKKTIAVLGESGHAVTDATRHAIAQTLRALPADDPPGRLGRALAPGGFEMLAGITVQGGGAGARAAKAAAPSPKADTRQAAKPAEDRRLAEAREEATAAAKALRETEQEARRAEFEAARAARAAARAEELLADARAGLEAARTRLVEAEADAEAAGRKKQASDRALAAATQEVGAARQRAEAAARTVKKHTS